MVREQEAHLATKAAKCFAELLGRHKEVSQLRLEVTEAQRGSSNASAHLSVLRRISEKLSADMQADSESRAREALEEEEKEQMAKDLEAEAFEVRLFPMSSHWRKYYSIRI